MVTEVQLHSHTKILVKRVPDNVPAMTISFLFHKHHLNQGLIRYLSNCLEWVESSWCDLDQRESSRNIFDCDLESSRCDYNLQNLGAQVFQPWNYFHAQYF